MTIKDQKQLPCLNWIEDSGARKLRRLANGKQFTTEQLQAGGNVVLKELQLAGCLYLEALKQQQAAELHRAEAAEQQKKRAAKEEQDRWAAIPAKLGPVLEFLQQQSIAAPQLITATGNFTTFDPRRVGKAKQVRLMLQKGFVGLIVADEIADAFAKEHDLPDTLCWTSEGRRVWIYSDSAFVKAGTSAMCVKGDRIQLAASQSTRFEPDVYATATNAKFVTPPSKALPKDSAELPSLPEALAKELAAVAGASKPEHVDKIILN